MKTWLNVIFVTFLTAISFAQIPASSHVVMVVEQNHSYSSVIGSSAMPYLNSLASKYGLATHYYANTHPAIGNYFQMTTGSVLTNDNSLTPSSFPVTADNIVDQMMLAGKTWKSYAEDLPYAGYTGGNTGNYAVRNNPFAYFASVQNSNAQKMNLVPFTQFAADLNSNQLPEFSYIVPNQINDGAAGSMAQSDAWLKQNIASLLADPNFQKDGLLIITFEESASTDTTHGGGHVATLVIGPNVIPGYKSTTLYQHQSLLRTVLSALGATSFPGTAAVAPLMSEFFAAPATTLNAATANAATAPSATRVGGVTISSPASGATVPSSVNFVASAVSSTSRRITAMRLYVDNVTKYTVNAANLNTTITLPAGAHNITVVAWDSSGRSYTKSITITVTSSSLGTLAATPGSLNFGSVYVGSSASQIVTLKASTASVTISQRNISSGFTLSGISLPLTLAAGQSASFTVTYTPTSAVVTSGSLSLLSNASNSTLNVGLVGTGASSTSVTHSVAMTWNASSGASGYNVYRSTSSGGSYTKLTSSLDTGTSYTDSSVNAGTTYYYVVTAVGSSGAESGYSSQVTAIIPNT